MPPKILIVDDDQAIAELIRSRLEHEGFIVDVAQDAVIALGKIQDRVPDLITLDILMPGMIGDHDKYGASLCEALKFDETYRNIPIVMVSGVNIQKQPEIAEMVEQADGFIPKPFVAEDLVHKINKILAHKHM